jgi:hypothetical protein
VGEHPSTGSRLSATHAGSDSCLLTSSSQKSWAIWELLLFRKAWRVAFVYACCWWLQKAPLSAALLLDTTGDFQIFDAYRLLHLNFVVYLPFFFPLLFSDPPQQRIPHQVARTQDWEGSGPTRNSHWIFSGKKDRGKLQSYQGLLS